MQNMWLGIAAGGMVAVQMIVIPRLRREIIRLSRQRQIASRALAGRVAAVQQQRAAGAVEKQHPSGAAVDNGHAFKPIARPAVAES